MPNTSRSDCQLGQRLASQYGIDAVQSLVSRSRWGAELGVARMRYELPHLFVLAPLPTEDAFLLSVEINSGGSRRIVRDGDSRQLGLQQEGAFHIADLSQRASAYVSSPFHSMFFHLPRATLDAFADEMEMPRVDRLRCDAGTLDPVIANLGRAMLPVLMRPQEASRLFVDHVALALKAHVVHVYGDAVGFAPVRTRGGLASWQERRAKAFLMQHLAGDVSLADAARECTLSRSHFSKAFKQTTGQTPHAWLVTQRVEAARRLLGQPHLPIAEIAARCGFSDQSHLTRVFSAHTGTSPARWRRLNAG
ncbi:AraC family transcriptional regulator [Variovorax sp. J22G21]|uniref:AraC family transcriptional regulator n=1 Tax=Variovorax fucosicus TaxID=3053517 RepID=UPI0025783F11|nr:MULTISPECIES: AraC family transcriptional regulator [unclassified Variovorax]MDM0037568.1 AraC family transcriptional regulator [Variovorax sp. J22R193]MDM0062344.1 AraC family transcriptional regulator [Variovorax sp. J22G21]